MYGLQSSKLFTHPNTFIIALEQGVWITEDLLTQYKTSPVHNSLHYPTRPLQHILHSFYQDDW